MLSFQYSTNDFLVPVSWARLIPNKGINHLFMSRNSSRVRGRILIDATWVVSLTVHVSDIYQGKQRFSTLSNLQTMFFYPSWRKLGNFLHLLPRWSWGFKFLPQARWKKPLLTAVLGPPLWQKFHFLLKVLVPGLQKLRPLVFLAVSLPSAPTVLEELLHERQQQTMSRYQPDQAWVTQVESHWLDYKISLVIPPKILRSLWFSAGSDPSPFSGRFAYQQCWQAPVEMKWLDEHKTRNVCWLM